MGLFVANLGTITTEVSAIKTVEGMLHIPVAPFIIAILMVAFLFITRGTTS